MANRNFFFLEPIKLTEQEATAGLHRALSTCTGAEYRAFRTALDATETREQERRTA